MVSFLEVVRELSLFDPLYVSVTYGAGGSTQDRTLQKGHIESPFPEADLDYTKQKVDAGADFAITQMFFDNCYFFAFREKAEKSGIRIPIFPGIMPITDLAKVKRFTSFCGATVPS